MANPAFIVEGQMEQRILSKICPGRPIRRINCNGDGVAIPRLCDFLETQIRTLSNRNYPIVVIFDREQRDQTCDEIRDEVISNLHARGLHDHDIRVFVADRETEDWYLLDTKGICSHFGLPTPISKLSGKGGLSKLLRPALQYHETSVGVELFHIVSKKTIASKSPVFQSLLDTAIEIECGFAIDPELL